jgi:transposase
MPSEDESVRFGALLDAQVGHRVRRMSPQFVIPHLKENKNEPNDAEAIREAATEPPMRSYRQE